MLGLGLNFGSSQSGSSAARMGGPGLLLDTYGSAAAAYSLRKLNSSYGGKVLQVRRASDHVEVDVGFDADGLLSLDSPVTNVTEESTGITQGSSTNAAKLGEFCGEARRSGGDTSYATVDSMTEAAHVEVVTWYDQSGNTNDATQAAATRQPRVYDRSSGLTLENGKAAVLNQGGLQELLLTSAINSSTNISAVAKANHGGWGYLTGQSFDGGLRQNDGWYASNPNTDDYHYNGSLYLDGILTTSSASAQQQRLIFANATSGGSTLSLVNIGGTYQGRHWNGPIQEIIYWGTDQSGTPQSGIETNVNTFYSIY